MSVAPDRLAAVTEEFPVLRRTVDGRPIVYLDSAATSQTPQVVIDAIVDYYTNHRGSVHRGVYDLITEATELYEGARERIAAWLNWEAEETIFTANATMSLNLVAQAWGHANLGPGDLVVLTEMEHHSNVVPWQQVCAQRGAEIAYIAVTDTGELDPGSVGALLDREPKVVAFTHVSNVLGTINPAAELARQAHAAGAVVVVDGTQAVPQIPVDLAVIDADFYAWTGHKVYGPTGVGVLHGRRALLEEMPPFHSGGHMISQVFTASSTWSELPGKFEAGTAPIAEAIGLGAAVDFVTGIGIDAIRAHEFALTAELLERLTDIDGVTVHGGVDPAARGALVSFGIEGAHPHDIGEILGRDGVCVRTGHHCAQPLMRRFGWGSTTRASFGVHNGPADIDRLIEGIHTVQRVLDL
ncbi:SufS family cysteine desulfurase [Conexibacter sp. DBS9H8]|uniref:SufS family cysteine desulfurase n=1 Tax=Conexibacter sp. DBS9H8 TaxID=2937801 RepID=UPI002010AAA1|nr:SufS family cysteine desulfurase [Conexibacter sp. DBS9H8]